MISDEMVSLKVSSVLSASLGTMGFSLNGEEFAEFTEFKESTEAWIRINLTIFSVSCVSVEQW